jgi:hypothetical protein
MKRQLQRTTNHNKRPGKTEQQIANVGTLLLLLFLWLPIPYFFFIHEGYLVLLMPKLAKPATVSELHHYRYFRLKGEVPEDIIQSEKTPGLTSQSTLAPFDVHFVLKDETGATVVRFHNPFLNKPEGKVEILGTVAYGGVFAVKVNDELPWPELVFIILVFLFIGWVTYAAFSSMSARKKGRGIRN